MVDINQLLNNLYSRRDSLDFLDIGCGSSLTLFQAVESIENQIEGININGYGLTASPQFLNIGSNHMMETSLRNGILKNYTPGTSEYRKTELLLDGVQENEQEGLHRYSVNGNLMKFKKGDVHYLEVALSTPIFRSGVHSITCKLERATSERRNPSGASMPLVYSEAVTSGGSEVIDNVFLEQKFDLVYSSAAYPHLLCPWLAFEESANALKNGGILLIDSMPTTDIVNKNGEVVSPDDYVRLFREANPGYEINFQSSSNPFYAPLVIQKRTDEDVNTLLQFGQLGKRTMQEVVVGILDQV